MLCRSPFVIGTLECSCGGCLPCRINRRRVWAHRILLESFKHADSCFVTLTYNDESVPSYLDKSDYQDWLKRFRKALAPSKVRYFLAGEYGEVTGRPHFHAALFGVSPYVAGGLDGRGGLLAQTWGHGFTLAGTLTWESAQYIAGYLTKKLVDHGEHKEFCRMSLRPGIGAWAMGDVARALSSDAGLDSVVRNFDVPSVLKHGKRMLPLGRYLRRRLRAELGFSSLDTPVDAVRLQGLRASDEMVEKRRSLVASGLKSWEAHNLMLDMRSQKINNMEARFRIREPQRSLV